VRVAGEEEHGRPSFLSESLKKRPPGERYGGIKRVGRVCEGTKLEQARTVLSEGERSMVPLTTRMPEAI